MNSVITDSLKSNVSMADNSLHIGGSSLGSSHMSIDKLDMQMTVMHINGISINS
jgi:hypothetical protein